MKSLLILLTAPLALLVPALPAAAQTVPAGSYLQSCDSVHVADGVLHARCQAVTEYHDKAIGLAACEGAVDIMNHQGDLLCFTRNKANWGGQVLPVGSYVASCNYIAVRNGVLVGGCRRKDGSYRSSTLSLKTCPGSANISNLNGHLTCTA